MAFGMRRNKFFWRSASFGWVEDNAANTPRLPDDARCIFPTHEEQPVD